MLKSILSRIPGFGLFAVLPMRASWKHGQSSKSEMRSAFRKWLSLLQFVMAATVVSLAGCGGGGIDPALINFITRIPLVPTITEQPRSGTSIDGISAAFRVAASGVAPLSYQWRRNGVEIPGATDTEIAFPVTLADSGNIYSVVVSNVNGSVTSNDATLIVAPVAPAVVVPPQGVAVAAGQSATFTVNAAGSEPLSFQWRRNGVDIPGAVTASYTTPAATVADNGVAFSVAVTNAAGSRSSGNGILTVTPAPILPVISLHPNNVTVATDQTATLSVVAAGTAPLSFQWRRNGTDIAGATDASYTTPPTRLADDGDQFVVVVSNAAGNVTSSIAILTVNPRTPLPQGRYLEVWATIDSTTATGRYDFAAVDPSAPTNLIAVDQTPFFNPSFSSLRRVLGGVYDPNTATLSDIGSRHVVYLKGGSIYKVTLDNTGPTPAPVRLSAETQAQAASLLVSAQSLSGDEALISYREGLLDQTRFVRLSTVSAATPFQPPLFPGDSVNGFLITWSNDPTTGAITGYIWNSLTATGQWRLFRTDANFGNPTNLAMYAHPILSAASALFGGNMRRGFFFIADGALRRLDFASGDIRQVMPGITGMIGGPQFDDENIYVRVQTATGIQLVKAGDTHTSTAIPLATGPAAGTLNGLFKQTRDYLIVITNQFAHIWSIRKSDGAMTVLPPTTGFLFSWVVAGAPGLLNSNVAGNRVFYSNIDAAGNPILGSVLADGTNRKEVVGRAMGFGVFPDTIAPHRLSVGLNPFMYPYDQFLVVVGQEPVPAGSATLPLAWMNAGTGDLGAVVGSERVSLSLAGSGISGITSWVKGRADTFTIEVNGRYDAFYFTEQAGSLLRLSTHIP